MFNTEETKRMFRFASIAFIVLAVFLAIQSLHGLRSIKYVGRGTPPTNVITVAGQGEVFATPDIATFTFGSQVTAKTVSEAQKQVTEKIDRALDVMKKYNIASRDIQTTGYNISPHYEFTQIYCITTPCPSGRSEITGYDVSQSITVKVRKIEDIGAIIGELGSVELSDVSGIQFMIDQDERYKAEARGKAIDDAKEKAKILAKQLGVSLGEVVSFYEGGDYLPYAKFGLGGAADAASAPAVPSLPELPAGQNKIVSNVSITYEIR